MLTLAETFAGIGGWSEAARMAGGIRPVWVSEIHKYKNLVYELRHPGVPNLGDIRNITSAPYADIFTVSFPCTDISVMGKGAGIEGQNSRLWFEALRLIGSSRPKYVVIENSPILTIRGFDRILSGLAGLGYDAEWTHLQGTQFGVQQRRKRLYCVAYAAKNGQLRQYPESIFRRIQTGGGRNSNTLILPGWRERRDIPEPRTVRSAHDVPDLIHRLECIGDAIMPLIGMYVLECVKIHHAEK
mgnify:CR=1 FL=1